MRLQDFKVGQTVRNTATGQDWIVVNINGSTVTVQRTVCITGRVFNEYDRWIKVRSDTS